jgi:hypothetical protein
VNTFPYSPFILNEDRINQRFLSFLCNLGYNQKAANTKELISHQRLHQRSRPLKHIFNPGRPMQSFKPERLVIIWIFLQIWLILTQDFTYSSAQHLRINLQNKRVTKTSWLGVTNFFPRRVSGICAAHKPLVPFYERQFVTRSAWITMVPKHILCLIGNALFLDRYEY